MGVDGQACPGVPAGQPGPGGAPIGGPVEAQVAAREDLGGGDGGLGRTHRQALVVLALLPIRAAGALEQRCGRRGVRHQGVVAATVRAKENALEHGPAGRDLGDAPDVEVATGLVAPEGDAADVRHRGGAGTGEGGLSPGGAAIGGIPGGAGIRSRRDLEAGDQVLGGAAHLLHGPDAVAIAVGSQHASPRGIAAERGAAIRGPEEPGIAADEEGRLAHGEDAGDVVRGVEPAEVGLGGLGPARAAVGAPVEPLAVAGREVPRADEQGAAAGRQGHRPQGDVPGGGSHGQGVGQGRPGPGGIGVELVRGAGLPEPAAGGSQIKGLAVRGDGQAVGGDAARVDVGVVDS